MAYLYRSETIRETVAIRRFRVAALIADLSRAKALLTIDIEQEEVRAGVRDSDSAYPVLARTLRTRRNNIEITNASLEALVHEIERAA